MKAETVLLCSNYFDVESNSTNNVNLTMANDVDMYSNFQRFTGSGPIGSKSYIMSYAKLQGNIFFAIDNWDIPDKRTMMYLVRAVSRLIPDLPSDEFIDCHMM